MQALSHEREHRNSVERLELLAGVASDLLRFQKADDFLESVFRRLVSSNGVDLCFCHQVKGRERLQLLFSAGLPAHLRDRIQWLDFGDGLFGKVAQERGALQPQSIQQSDDPSLDFLKSIGIDAFCCYPLITNEKLLGTLSFGTKRSASFEPDELEMLHALASEVAIALDRLLLLNELAESNNKLAAMNADLRRANLDLEQFAFSASHALREPLRNLAIHTELLRRKELALDEEAQHCLSVVLASSERMEALFRDLLAFIQMDRTTPDREVDPNPVLKGVLVTLEQTIRETGATIEADRLPGICISDRHLFQLFLNLIENAIKYGLPGVRPQIRIDWYAVGDEAVICVRDNGMGIALQNQERVFELFKRLHTSEEYKGTGLGLAMCQKIVEQHGGRIWVQSELGKGAAFCFRLRRAAEGLMAQAARSG